MTSGSLIEGPLQRRTSTYPHKWLSRYFVLVGHRLRYYKDGMKDKKASGEYDLSARNAIAFLPKDGNEMEVRSGDQTIKLRAETEEDAESRESGADGARRGAVRSIRRRARVPQPYA